MCGFDTVVRVRGYIWSAYIISFSQQVQIPFVLLFLIFFVDTALISKIILFQALFRKN